MVARRILAAGVLTLLLTAGVEGFARRRSAAEPTGPIGARSATTDIAL